jgi:hypothetical protein
VHSRRSECIPDTQKTRFARALGILSNIEIAKVRGVETSALIFFFIRRYKVLIVS